ncbi:MAG: hypothetical protein OIN83_03905 [Candidatus Methanoperedens sp.]|nr:hypothetical protein [Candidatus Methanoperedens sp.]
MINDSNAQIYTLEGIATAILMIGVVIFIVKAAPLTPLTASYLHQSVEEQIETWGNDLLTVMDYVPEVSLNSQLKQSIIDWKGQEFDGQAQVIPQTVNLTASSLKEVFGNSGIAYNLELSFSTPSGISTRAMLWNGRPSDNAVIASRKIILHDEDMSTNPTLSAIIPDMDTFTKFYNMVDVRLTLWWI